jgi:hypothetical protein
VEPLRSHAQPRGVGSNCGGFTPTDPFPRPSPSFIDVQSLIFLLLPPQPPHLTEDLSALGLDLPLGRVVEEVGAIARAGGHRDRLPAVARGVGQGRQALEHLERTPPSRQVNRAVAQIVLRGTRRQNWYRVIRV